MPYMVKKDKEYRQSMSQKFTKTKDHSPLAPIGGSSLFFPIFHREKSYCRKREIHLLKITADSLQKKSQNLLSILQILKTLRL